MAFRPPPFRPVLPLSRGAATAQTLAGVLQRFGARKERDRQEQRDLIAALELQDLKTRNQVMVEQIRSQFRVGEARAEFDIEAPERAFKQTELKSQEEQKRLDRESRERIARIRAGRSSAQDRVAQRAIDKEQRLKKTTFGGRNPGQLSDDIRSTRQLPLRDEFGDPTGQRGFETPEHQQQHEFNKSSFELLSSGFSDADLEKLGLSSQEAINQYSNLKKAFNEPIQTGPPDKPGGPAEIRLLTKPQIIKLMKAGLTLEMIDNGIQTLRQNPKFARSSRESLLKLLLRELK